MKINNDYHLATIKSPFEDQKKGLAEEYLVFLLTSTAIGKKQNQ